MHRPHRPILLAVAASILAAACAAVAQTDQVVSPDMEPTYRCGVRTAPPKPPGAIRLATYNVENLFDDIDDPALEGRFDDCWAWDKTIRAKPEPHNQAVAKAIRAIDADIIGLQEIESYDALIAFREAHLSGMGYDHVVSIDVAQERGIEQAVISRFPIKEARVWPNMSLDDEHPPFLPSGRDNQYAGQPLEYRRSPLYVRIEIPADVTGAEPYELSLFVIHHKSGRDNDFWRVAEARALVNQVAAYARDNQSQNIAILGDFNAQPNEQSVRAYTDNGFSFAIDERPQTSPATHTHASSRAIDFILVNDNLKNELVPESAFVLATPLRPRDADWRNTAPPLGYASDHMPVAVDLVPQDR